MSSEMTDKIEKAVLLGLANHTNEFLNPGFAPGLSHEQCAEILERIMKGRLVERIESLITSQKAIAEKEAVERFAGQIITDAASVYVLDRNEVSKRLLDTIKAQLSTEDVKES